MMDNQFEEIDMGIYKEGLKMYRVEIILETEDDEVCIYSQRFNSLAVEDLVVALNQNTFIPGTYYRSEVFSQDKEFQLGPGLNQIPSKKGEK